MDHDPLKIGTGYKYVSNKSCWTPNIHYMASIKPPLVSTSHSRGCPALTYTTINTDLSGLDLRSKDKLRKDLDRTDQARPCDGKDDAFHN